MENFATNLALTPTEKNPQWAKPLFARCKLHYNHAYNVDGTPNMNKKGYKPYYSIDWNNKTNVYDERAGIEDLINRMIKFKPAQATGWATLYINLTLDLDTSKRGYEYKIAHFIGHANTMPRFQPVFMTMPNGSKKIDITNTLMAVRELNEQVNILKMMRYGR